MGKRQIAITLGCDPELMVRKKTKAGANGPWVTAHGLIPGNKHDPYKILNGSVQVDGCALEFGIEPANNQTEWFTRIDSVLTSLKGMLPDHNVLIVPGVEFPEDYFMTKIPEAAKMLGCEPDWNAWTGEQNPPPDTSTMPFYRAAGGHIHIGWTKNKDPFDTNHFEDCRVVVKQMDYYLGIPMMLIDKDDKRRQLYGKAGAFRPKPYGVEYRTLSNMWLTSGGLIDFVYYATRWGVYNLTIGKNAEESYKDTAQGIINSGERSKIKSNLLLAGWNPNTYLKETRGPQWREK